MRNIHIAPSILAADFTRLGDQVKSADLAGANLIHVDVMDGRFVPNITMGPLVVEAVRSVTSLPLDVHLMIVEPERHLEAFAKSGADRITVHIEVSPNLHRTLQAIRDLGCKSGVAVNPHTPANALSDIMDMVDVINIMTVNPGFGGQKYLDSVTPKIQALRKMILAEGRDIDLEVDGGINTTTAKKAVEAGANVLIVGSAIFSDHHTVEEGMSRIRESIK